jgi:hypothetical protein
MSDDSGKHARHDKPVYPNMSRHLLVIAIILVSLMVLCVPPVRHVIAIPMVWLVNAVTDFCGLLGAIVVGLGTGFADLF